MLQKFQTGQQVHIHDKPERFTIVRRLPTANNGTADDLDHHYVLKNTDEKFERVAVGRDLEVVNEGGAGATTGTDAITQPRASGFEGRTVCFTGILEIPRKNAKDIVKGGGGRVVDNLSSGVDFLICGQKPGSKFGKARELGIQVLTEDEWENMCRANPLGDVENTRTRPTHR